MREQDDCTLIRVIHRDSTIRLVCQTDDYILCIKFSPILRRNNGFDLVHAWRMQDGDTVTITNRFNDLPPWFDLLPSEVEPDSISWLRERQAKGYRTGHRIEKPNVWRMLAGEKIIRIGTGGGSPTGKSKTTVVDLKHNALVIGESTGKSPDEVNFCEFDRSELDILTLERVQTGFQAAIDLGFPWNVPQKWSFG